MTILFNNNVYSTLAAAITTTGQTSVTVQTGHGDRFPVVASPDVAYVTLKSAGGTVEIVKITARTLGSDVLTVVRAQEGTTAVTWSIGDVVSMRLTAHSLNSFGTNNWELVSVGGTANAITATVPAKVTAYTTNHIFRGIAAATNTGSVTLNLTPFGGAAIGAVNVYKGTGLALEPGDIQAGSAFCFMYDGTRMQLVRGAVDSSRLATDLTAYLLPSDADKWRGIYRAGFDHAFRNQQWGGPWGGEMLDAATGTLYRTEFATGYIDSNTYYNVGGIAGQTYISEGLKVPETQTVSAIWVKLFKVGNPTNNFSPFLYTDTGGSPNALQTNGTATAQSGKLHVSGTDQSAAQWYRFPFATPPSLTGGTQYHGVLKSSGAVDASNYWAVAGHSAGVYPFGFKCTGDGTPTWTQVTAGRLCMLLELSSTAQISQSSGIFDGKLAFGGSDGFTTGTGSMSRGLCSSVPLHELIDLNEFTLRVAGTAFTKDATILDIGYGQDHDRIVLRSAVTTGYATLTVYGQTGTVYTVTGSTDISSGNQDIIIHVKAKADGSDKVELYVNGASQGTPLTSQTITFDAAFRNLGTMWVGGGFALAPTWSVSSIGTNGFSGLPSTLGWTHGGSATEANVWSVSGGKAYQNGNGDTGSQESYYTLTIAGVNATGSFSSFKLRVAKNTNTKDAYGCLTDHIDGTKRSILQHAEYYNGDAIAANLFYPQVDMKFAESIIERCLKGSDGLVFRNHRLLIDDTNNLAASASNYLRFGDVSTTAGEKADVVWSAAKYYIGGSNPPQFTSGSISELAIWSGDRTSLAASLYNAGTLVSVKQYCGLQQNYLDKSGKLPVVELKGITSDPTTTTTGVPSAQANEMECFAVTEFAEVEFSGRATNSADQSLVSVIPSIDGVPASTAGMGTHSSVAGGSVTLSTRTSKQLYLGLHKFGVLWSVGSNTGTLYGTTRNMEVRPKV